MSKRDAIIISVLINAGLLAILFVTAIKSYPEQFPSDNEIDRSFIDESSALVLENNKAQLESSPLIVASPLDEVDNVLKEYLPQSTKEVHVPHASSQKTVSGNDDRKEKYLEVTVKRGDALEKIARINGTTVETLRKINHLSTDKLKIGQVLKVPPKAIASAKEVKKVEPVESTLDKQYYTVKSGDNPWKIAKQFNVKFDDLLDLNDLDEEKARNLKVGDRIRVK